LTLTKGRSGKKVFSKTLAGGTPQEALIGTLAALLMSPSFTLMIETPSQNGRLVEAQIAARLSFPFWDSGPDADLQAQVAAGALKTKEGVVGLITKMRASPKAARFTRRFVDSWLDLEKLPSLTKAGDAQALFTADMSTSMADEARMFSQAIYSSPSSDLAELLTSSNTFVNANLAKIYGAPGTFTNTLVRTDVSLEDIAVRFVASGNMRQLVEDCAASDAFVSRKFQ
jgi:hypothetical protein